MKNKIFLKAFYLIVLVLVYIQYKSNFLDLPSWFKVFIILSSLTLIPGYFLFTILYKNEFYDFFDVIPLSFVLGLLFIAPFVVVSYIVEMSLSSLVLSYFIACIVLGLADIIMSSMNKTEAPPVDSKKKQDIHRKNKDRYTTKLSKEIEKTTLQKRLKGLNYGLIIILILVFYLSLHYGGWPSGDFIIHLPKIRQIIELNKITYGDFFIKELDRCNRGHNILHPLLAMVSKICYIDPIELWAVCIPVFALVSLLAFFISTRVVFKNQPFAYFSTFIWFLWRGIFNIDFGTKHAFWMLGSGFPCPSHFMAIFGPIIIYFVFNFINQEKNKYLYILSPIGISFALIHMVMYLHILFAIGAFFIFSIFFKNGVRNLTKKLLLCILFLSFPGFVYTFYMQNRLNRPIINPVYQSMTGEVSPGWNPVIFLDKDKKYPLIDPFKGLWPGVLEKIAFVSIIFLIFHLKSTLWAIYLFSVPITVLLVLLNPILLHFLYPIHPPMQAYYTVVSVIPYHWLFSFFIFNGLELVKKKYGPKVFYFIVFIFVIFLGKYTISGIDYLKKIPYTTAKTIEMVRANADFVRRINEIIEPGSVVLMDENKIWFWPVFFPHFMLTHPNRGLFVPNFDPTPRREGLKNFLENPLTEDSFKFLNEYNVDYLVIDRKYLQNKDFDKHKNRFREIFSIDTFVIYKYFK